MTLYFNSVKFYIPGVTIIGVGLDVVLSFSDELGTVRLDELSTAELPGGAAVIDDNARGLEDVAVSTLLTAGIRDKYSDVTKLPDEARKEAESAVSVA